MSNTDTDDAKERIYDEQIAPLLMQAATIAEQNGIAVACYVQWGSDGSAHTAALPHDKWPGARIAYYAVQCAGNADSLILAILKDARVHGHNSIFLWKLERE